MLGGTVGHYEILDLLGRGGMGEVYRARDFLLGRQVAIKRLSPAFREDKHKLERFFQEAKSISALDHPNICTIYEVEITSDNVPVIVMAYYEGETLRPKIDRGLLASHEAVGIAIEILKGLSQAHQRGIVHHDIKPSNVMVTSDGQVKILDFGIAKLKDEQAGTLTQGLTGTLPYISPEQLAGKIDERSDLWATGVLLYEMLTGRLPFYGDSAAEILQRILNQQPESVSALRPAVSLQLDRVLMRALEKDPKRRYQTAQSMIADLRNRTSSAEETLSFAVPSPVVNAPQTPSVAVLPFASFAPADEAEYFSDGLTEEIIHALSRLKGMRVVSRTSAFEFKGKAQDVRVIADRLGVDSVLEGSVRISGHKLRVAVLLTNAKDGCGLWSQRFDRELADVFSIQEEIATSVATRLCNTLTQESAAQLSSRRNTNMDAWNLCLKARHHWHQGKPESLEKARLLYEQALTVDPKCSIACAALADYHGLLAFWGIVDPRRAWSTARELAAKAIELDPLQPRPYITTARYLQHIDRNRKAAEREFRRAIDLNPGDSEPHVAWAIFLLQLARFDEALQELRLARDIDPLNLMIAAGVAWLHCYRVEYDQALAECLQARELNPNYLETFACMAWISEAQGRIDEAESWLERAVAESARAPISLAMLGRHYALYGKPDKAREISTFLEELSSKRYVSPVTFAFISAALGEVDQALDHLDHAYEVHDPLLSYAKVYPPFEPVRNHPRFLEILNNLGLIETATASLSAFA